MTFLSLHNEVLLEVADKLACSNLKDFSKIVEVNRQLYCLLNPYTYRLDAQASRAYAQFWAAERDQEATLLKSLENGAYINARKQPLHSYTALHFAVIYRRAHIVKLLLAKGADVNALDRNNNPPLRFAMNLRRGSHDPGLDVALSLILIEYGADVNTIYHDHESRGCSALHVAAFEGAISGPSAVRPRCRC